MVEGRQRVEAAHGQATVVGEISVRGFDEDMFEVETPKDVTNMFKMVLSPKQLPLDNGGETSTTKSGGFKIPYDVNSCVVFSPMAENSARIINNWESSATDRRQHGSIGSGYHQQPQITEALLANMDGSTSSFQNNTVAFFTPRSPNALFSSNFFNELGLDNERVTLVSPQQPDAISPSTPVVLKRRGDGKKDEFDVYLPPCYTPALVETIYKTFTAQELTMFPFPPVEDTSSNSAQHRCHANGSLESRDCRSDISAAMVPQRTAATALDNMLQSDKHAPCGRNGNCDSTESVRRTTSLRANGDCGNSGPTDMRVAKGPPADALADIYGSVAADTVQVKDISAGNGLRPLPQESRTGNSVPFDRQSNDYSVGLPQEADSTTSYLQQRDESCLGSDQQRLLQVAPWENEESCGQPLSTRQRDKARRHRGYTPSKKTRHQTPLATECTASDSIAQCTSPSRLEMDLLSTSVPRKQSKVTEMRNRFKEVRQMHNNIEKQRRCDMQTRFKNLRDSIPLLVSDKKASKVQILKVARTYVRQLEDEFVRLDELKQRERERNKALLDRLCSLTNAVSQ